MIIDIPIEILELENNSYHIILSAKFDNRIFGNLIIDTGASKTVFDSTFVEPFIINQKELNDANSSGINAMIPKTKMGTIPLISFRKLIIKNYSCITMDLSHVNKLYKVFSEKQIAGLLGSDFLVEHEAVINFHQKKLTLNTHF
ncbi:MAG: aspartyl protease family protein [Salinivirgaceae bacterium]|nr:aspartyl protease family protein [Salinivirgaceae bacterium]